MPSLASDQKVRRTGIGGSDIAKIVGQSRWGGAMDVFLEKIGQSAPLVETEAMHWGITLEDAVAKEYAHRTGRKVRRSNQTIRHEDFDWRMAHIDRKVVTLASEPTRGLECKTAGSFASADFGEPGTDQVPPDYALQCMWYLGVTGWDVWDLAVLIGGNTFRIYTIQRDDELIELLWTAADSFWENNVLAKEPPAVDGSESTKRYLEGKHTDPEDEIPMSDELYGFALHYENLSRTIKDAGVARDLVGNKIRDALNGKGKARRDNAKVAWSIVSSRRLDTAALTLALPEVVAPFYVESETHRLSVTVKEVVS